MAASAQEVLSFVWCLRFHSEATNQSRAPTRALKTSAPPPCRTMAAIVWSLFHRDLLWRKNVCLEEAIARRLILIELAGGAHASAAVS